MALNWIDVNEFSFNCFLLMERFQIRLMCGGYRDSENWKSMMSIALNNNPAVKWYLMNKCPECADFFEEITANAPTAKPDEVRSAEVFIMSSVEDFVTYTRPEIMDKSSDYIYAWSKERLYELADFTDKTVLDVGSGSGRLAFAAAGRARQVFASEPVDTLREYLRDKAAQEGISNLKVSDGMANDLPYPDDTFDIVMSGHVVGDDYDSELAELERVAKSGGWLLDCPGEDSRNRKPRNELLKRGWEEFYYASSLGGDVYRYRKQIIK